MGLEGLLLGAGISSFITSIDFLGLVHLLNLLRTTLLRGTDDKTEAQVSNIMCQRSQLPSKSQIQTWRTGHQGHRPLLLHMLNQQHELHLETRGSSGPPQTY